VSPQEFDTRLRLGWSGVELHRDIDDGNKIHCLSADAAFLCTGERISRYDILRVDCRGVVEWPSLKALLCVACIEAIE